VLALALALPISLAMAVLAAEFAPSRIGQAMRALLGLMSGIPPIIYALMAIVFVAPFMIPSSPATSRTPTCIPRRSRPRPPTRRRPTCRGTPGRSPGVRAAATIACSSPAFCWPLLAIPFMAPLIEDALRNVPVEPKQASLALGASRWYTLVHITLPHALSGIVSAVRLGMLKVLGELMIALFVVGYAAPRFPGPAVGRARTHGAADGCRRGADRRAGHAEPVRWHRLQRRLCDGASAADHGLRRGRRNDAARARSAQEGGVMSAAMPTADARTGIAQQPMLDRVSVACRR